ncbi:nuclear factor interleukin-3-regulated protein-like [Lepisosteus oculatus]|uniref:nuclear factor interleukin-3-regulated protein-like n=1 Tax=Lepisosteus oculatus TaxID=7918 RepID=UPI0037182DDC
MESPFVVPMMGAGDDVMPRDLERQPARPGVGLSLTGSSRRKREFMPDEKKDASYWEKRRKNNEAAKRSREKRRVNDFVLESRLLALGEENVRLRAELLALKLRFGLLSPAAYAAHQPGLLQLRPLPPPPPGVPPLPDGAFWVKRRAERHCGQGKPPPAHPQQYPEHPAFTSQPGSAFTPTRNPLAGGYPYCFDKYPPYPAIGAPPPLAPLHPPAPGPWPGLPLPSRPPASKTASDEEEEEEQQVPAASEGDPRAALPHKLRLKARVPQERAESDGEGGAGAGGRGQRERAVSPRAEAAGRLSESD